jgi:uncharacterized Rmd1/YagE family protein
VIGSWKIFTHLNKPIKNKTGKTNMRFVNNKKLKKKTHKKTLKKNSQKKLTKKKKLTKLVAMTCVALNHLQHAVPGVRNST